MPSRIPNPRKYHNTDDFKIFMQFAKGILMDGTIEKESLKRIKSALRFYRMGKDASNIENKYINWWTGLEYLIRSGEPGAIIGEIEKRLIPVLILGYTSKFLECYKQTLIKCKVSPSEDFLKRYNVENNNDLSLTAIFDLIVKETSEYDLIKAQLKEYPVVIHHFDWFRNSTKDLASIKKFIERHDDGLRKHINRIWRIRCDIVHSAAYELNLTLLCANLEFYLKSLIDCILRQFQLNPSISSLTEFFCRADHNYTTLLNDLKNNEEKSFKYLLEGKHF